MSASPSLDVCSIFPYKFPYYCSYKAIGLWIRITVISSASGRTGTISAACRSAMRASMIVASWSVRFARNRSRSHGCGATRWKSPTTCSGRLSSGWMARRKQAKRRPESGKSPRDATRPQPSGRWRAASSIHPSISSPRRLISVIFSTELKSSKAPIRVRQASLKRWKLRRFWAQFHRRL